MPNFGLGKKVRMSKVGGYPLLTLIFVLIVAGCRPGLATPSPTPLPTATMTPIPTPTPSPTPTATPPAEESPEAPFTWKPLALDTVDSYTHHMHIDVSVLMLGYSPPGTLERYGQIRNRPTRAQKFITTYTTSYPPGFAGTLEQIYLFDEGKGWVREGEEEKWSESAVQESHFWNPFLSHAWWDPYALRTMEGFDFIGVEVVNGVSAYHYRKIGFSLEETECPLPSSEDWWVAVEGDYPVKGNFDAYGTCEGEDVAIHLLEEIDKINQPVDISPPL